LAYESSAEYLYRAWIKVHLEAGGVLKGAMKIRGGRTFHFNLNKRNDGRDFALRNYGHKKTKVNLHKDASWKPPTDSVVSRIDISLVRLLVKDSGVANHVNAEVEKMICTSQSRHYRSYSDFLASVDEPHDGEFDLGYDCRLLYCSERVMSLEIYIDEYFGGMHPDRKRILLSFDLRTGKRISLSDILLPRSKTQLNHIAEKYFEEENGSGCWYYEPGKFALNENFAIEPGGLLFSFDQYEAGPYPAGLPETFIPYTSIKGLLDPANRFPW
jgi:hypothetical protein